MEDHEAAGDDDEHVAANIEGQIAANDEDPIVAADEHREDLLAVDGGQDDDVLFMYDEGHNANDEEGLDMNDVKGDAMDGWDDPVVIDEVFPDET